MPQRFYISSSSMNALKLTVVMLVMNVALAYDNAGYCGECLNDNYKLIEGYINFIINIFILPK